MEDLVLVDVHLLATAGVAAAEIAVFEEDMGLVRSVGARVLGGIGGVAAGGG